ncbi:MAG: hypothetical protein R2911_17610 [Caldilineaceae bacterium]
MPLEQDLTIVPVLNKIDLPAAQPDDVAQEIEDLLAYPAEDIPHISAKSGLNIEAVLKLVVEQVPPPKGDVDAVARLVLTVTTIPTKA